MLFNSINFLFFFPTVIILYYAVSQKYRWKLLLAASYYFYMCWKVEYILLIVISTLVDFYAAKKMGAIKEKKDRKKYLYLSLVVNIGILFGFKYFNFFSDSIQNAFDYFNIFYDLPYFDVLLPVGISFYTFQTLSYSIDVYNDKIEPEQHLGIFAVYVSFFPQLVAGPIERPSNLLPQFHQYHAFDYDKVVSGLRLMLWGFFKKIVIADRLAYFVNIVYNSPEEYLGFQVVIATIFFAFQIYCDFSAYSDIAIGTARVMGYDLMENFRTPYHSKSIREFWQRWHISLSTWFRDYVYIPLGGNRVIKWRWYYNLWLTFLVSGLWHGANWTFVLWGALHGFYLVFAIVIEPYKKQLSHQIPIHFNKRIINGYNIVITFILVCFAWIFFRANNIYDAGVLISNSLQLDINQLSLNMFAKNSEAELIFAILFIGFMEMIHLLVKGQKVEVFLAQKPTIVRWGIYVLFVNLIIYFGIFQQGAFIYFQF